MSIRLPLLTFGLIVPAAALAASAPKSAYAPAIVASVDAQGRVTPKADGAGVAVPEPRPRASRVLPAACPSASPLSRAQARALVLAVATRERFFPDFVVAVAEIESHFDAAALSPKGAYGLMQLEPETARRFSVDLCDPAGNVLGGVRYLRFLHDRYRNPMFILSAYNAGESAMLRYRGVPPFPETVRFVADVLNAFYDWPRPALAATIDSGSARARPPSGQIIESFGDPPSSNDAFGAKASDAGVRHWD